MADRRDFFENLVYHAADYRRFTQQSPVMPDVWIQYGMMPGERQKLLVVPDWNYTTAALAAELRERLAADQDVDLSRFRTETNSSGTSTVVHNQNVVAGTLWFDELMRGVLPLSGWWHRSISRVEAPDAEDVLPKRLVDREAFVRTLTAAWAGATGAQAAVGEDTLWLARVAGLIAFISTPAGRERLEGSEDDKVDALKELVTEGTEIATALCELLTGIQPVYAGDPHPLYSVNRNRQAGTALTDSIASIKADASSRVFKVAGKGIRWAVIDSGVDATHTAFRRRKPDGTILAEPFAEAPRRRRAGASTTWVNNTRVLATYDFVHIETLLGTDPERVDELSRDWFPILEDPDRRSELSSILHDYRSRVVDWERLEPFLLVPHAPTDTGEGASGPRYRPPSHRHGTHVAGIIASDWRLRDADQGLPSPREEMIGVCPEIELIDVRVLDDAGSGSEFAIMSAMQFIRNLNSRKDFVAVHGVNLSLSIPHDVANYACGRTPVCEEAERMVGSGLVVVAAAGNSGRARYLTPSNEIDDGFRTVSITDPGNADGVITVGATHRRDAHMYGVSYFSSRGPTGDGRLKPDLVAPGEKIRSTVPGNGDERLDGTSMAAPHVSGAAALIMARHPELIGQPRRIKEVLCSTATDLGRERYFQGAGLLDTLRALQSI